MYDWELRCDLSETTLSLSLLTGLELNTWRWQPSTLPTIVTLMLFNRTF